jgi:hypothetical protein
MRDAIALTILIAPYLESDFISRRCEELLRAYQDASSLVYQHELEVHELCRLWRLLDSATFSSFLLVLLFARWESVVGLLDR